MKFESFTDLLINIGIVGRLAILAMILFVPSFIVYVAVTL